MITKNTPLFGVLLATFLSALSQAYGSQAVSTSSITSSSCVSIAETKASASQKAAKENAHTNNQAHGPMQELSHKQKAQRLALVLKAAMSKKGLFDIGRVYEKAGRMQDALECYEKAARNEDEQALYYLPEPLPVAPLTRLELEGEPERPDSLFCKL